MYAYTDKWTDGNILLKEILNKIKFVRHVDEVTSWLRNLILEKFLELSFMCKDSKCNRILR